MTRIVVIALALAFLEAAEREGRAAQCGTPLINAIAILGFLGVLFELVRLVLFAIRNPT